MAMNLFALLALLVLAHVANCQLSAPRIDTYETPARVEAVDNTTSIVTVADGTFLGTSRTLIASGTTSSALLTLLCEIGNGQFALSADITVTGTCMAIYDNIPQQDLISLGCTCWYAHLAQSDNNVDIVFDAFSNNSSATSAVNIPMDVAAPGGDLCIGFDLGSADLYTGVVGVNISIISQVALVDVVFADTCCAPSVSCWHEISMPSPARVGDVAIYTITCKNYPAFPSGRTEAFSVEFPANPAIAAINAASVSCSASATNVGTDNNRLSFDSTLAENENVTCSVSFDLVGAGVMYPVQASVVITQFGATSLSNEGVDRAATFGGICNPSVGSNVTVLEAVPSTEAPTEAPTPLPPTSQPPTTLAPTTSAPSTGPPVVSIPCKATPPFFCVETVGVACDNSTVAAENAVTSILAECGSHCSLFGFCATSYEQLQATETCESKLEESWDRSCNSTSGYMQYEVYMRCGCVCQRCDCEL